MHIGLERTLYMSPSAYIGDMVISSHIRILLLPWNRLGAQGPQGPPPPPQALTPTHPRAAIPPLGSSLLHEMPVKRYASLDEQESLAVAHHGVSQGFSLRCGLSLFCCLKTRHRQILPLRPTALSLLKQTAQTILSAEWDREMREVSSGKMDSYDF